MSGVPELLVLRLLARQEMYGYEIVRAVRLITQDAISLGEGVIYPVLHGLERSGALTAKRKPVNGRTRVYYSLTSKGRGRFERLASEWDRISGGIHSALGDREHATA
jgi:PadR family transcriptional regulator PadR